MGGALTRQFMLRQRTNQILNWIFPTDDIQCVICGRPIHARLHQANGQKMCPFCLQDLELCEARPQTLQLPLAKHVTLNVYSYLLYDHFIRTMIRSWKYDGVIELTTWFGDMLTNAYERLLNPKFDAVVPVPSTADRTQKRGYDHVRLLAAHLCDQTGLIARQALIRVEQDDGFTQSQTAKNVVARKKGLSLAYVHNKQVTVRGQHLLLIDDIVTTGATAEACTRPLLKAGAASVTCLVLARVM